MNKKDKKVDRLEEKKKRTSYVYDADGNLISQIGRDGTDKVELYYSYTVEDRLEAVYDKKELLMAAAYDGDGNRVFQLNYNLHTDEDSVKEVWCKTNLYRSRTSYKLEIIFYTISKSIIYQLKRERAFAIMKFQQEVNTRLENIIFHIDVNSAFLSWEAVFRLYHKGGKQDLRECASAVGGDMAMRHGIILAKSIPAKKYGIKTGETILEAQRKCPNLLLVPPNYSLYEECSSAFIDILREYSDEVEQYSVTRRS